MADEEDIDNKEEAAPEEAGEENQSAGDEAGGEGEDESSEKGGGKKKLIMMVGAVVFLLAGVGGGLYFTGMLDSVLGKGGEAAEHTEDGEHGDAKDGHADKKKSDKKKSDKKKSKKGDHGDEGYGEDSGFVEVPTMIVNLNTDDNDVPRYLRLTVQLELEDPHDKSLVDEAIPRVVDQFQTYLRELHVRDLKGSAGIYRLQMELLWRVNQAAAPAKVKDILFQEILIQ